MTLKRDYIGQTVVDVTGRETDEKAVGFLQFSQCGLNLAKFELVLNWDWYFLQNFNVKRNLLNKFKGINQFCFFWIEYKDCLSHTLH